MEHRFALRFENGERRGEVVPIVGHGLSVGRRPGSGLQILDASVSGTHAEFLAVSGSVHVRDLGSTNGTRVGAERVSERELAHGDEVMLGNVRMRFLDARLAEPAPSPLSAAAAASAATGDPDSVGERVRTVGAEAVARSGKRSLFTAALLLAAVGAAASAWYFSRGAARPSRASAVRPVEPVPGNLLGESASFEGSSAGGSATDAAPVAFALDPEARRSGEQGLSARLAAADANRGPAEAAAEEREGASAGPDWALHRSALVAVPRGGTLHGRAWVRTSGDAAVRVGLRFEDSAGTAGPTTAWGEPATPRSFAPLDLDCAVPGGYDRARLEILAALPAAGRGGTVEVDDASIVPGTAAVDERARVAVGEYELFLLGDPPAAATLFKIDRALIGDLHAARGPELGGRPDPVPLAATADERGISLAVRGGGAARLALRVEAPLVAGGIATVGPGGYRTHQIAFERDGVTSLLFGSGQDLVRLRAAAPVRVRGRPQDQAFLVELDPGSAWELQLVFREERVEARNLAHAAREAESQGRIGESIAAWTNLTDAYPFEADLLAEARAARARLVEAGLAEVRDLARRVERARFFGLIGLFRECRDAAEEVATRHAGTEVEEHARRLAAEIDADLAELERHLDDAERDRLQAIAAALAEDSPGLAARVRTYLEQRFEGGSR